MSRANRIVITLAVAAAIVPAAQATVTFTNDLTSEAGLVPCLEEADAVSPDADIVYAASGAQFGTVMAGNNGRNYIHSMDADYNTAPFVAEVTADHSTGGHSFMGFGGGYVGTYGTPDWDVTDTIWLEPGPGLSNTFTFDLGGAGPNGPTGAGALALKRRR